MITCKQDLINTYVKNTPELRREFLSLAVKFGLIDSKSEICESSEEAVVAYWRDVTGDNPRVGCWFSYADQIKEECRELTLYDLKPRTKVEYIICKPIPGDEVYLAHKNKSIRQSDALYLFIGESLDGKGVFQHLVSKNIFEESIHLAREKKERPVEWWEDAVEYIRSLNGEANAIDFTDSSSDGKKMAMNISVVLDERQAKDFARILLEQDGE